MQRYIENTGQTWDEMRVHATATIYTRQRTLPTTEANDKDLRHHYNSLETFPSALFLFETSGLGDSSSRFLDSSVATSAASCVSASSYKPRPNVSLVISPFKNSRSCLGCYSLHSGEFPEECSYGQRERLTRIRKTWTAVLFSLFRNRQSRDHLLRHPN